MVLRVQCSETISGDVGVDGGSRDISVAEQHLHRTQIGTVIQKVRRKSVAQCVG